MERIADFWKTIDRVRAKIGPLHNDVSFAEFLRRRRDLSPRVQELARMFVEGYHASHADRISARALRSADEEQEEESRQFRLAGGQDAILEWLRAGLDPRRTDLRLGAAVTRVEWSRGSVIVHVHSGRDERIRAKKLIVTIPVGVWKAPRDQDGAIDFDPPLREKTRALEKIEAGHVVKIAFRFRERFWDQKNFVHSSNRYMPIWWTSGAAGIALTRTVNPEPRRRRGNPCLHLERRRMRLGVA